MGEDDQEQMFPEHLAHITSILEYVVELEHEECIWEKKGKEKRGKMFPSFLVRERPIGNTLRSFGLFLSS